LNENKFETRTYKLSNFFKRRRKVPRIGIVNGNDYSVSSSYSNSAKNAIDAVDDLEKELGSRNVDGGDVKDAIEDLKKENDKGKVGADLAARATSLLEQAINSHDVNSSTKTMAVDLKDQLSQMSSTSSESTTTGTSMPLDTVTISQEAASNDDDDDETTSNNAATVADNSETSSRDAIKAVEEIEKELGSRNVDENDVENAIEDLKREYDNGNVSADLAAKAITLLEQAAGTNGIDRETAVLAKDMSAAVADNSKASSKNAIKAFAEIEEELGSRHVDDEDVEDAIKKLKKEYDNGNVSADLAAKAATLLEQAAETKGVDKSTTESAESLRGQIDLDSKTQGFQSLVNDLQDSNVDAETKNNIIGGINDRINQAQADYQDGKINAEQLSAALHTAIDEGAESINSAMLEAEDVAIAQAEKELPPGLAKKEELPPGLEKMEELPPGLEKLETSEASTEAPTEEVNIEELFETINKIVKLLKSETGNEGNNIEEQKKEETDPAKIEEELGNIISELEKMDYSKFADKLREMQTSLTDNKDMFGMAETGINRIGDNGDGSGNFNATRFMTSMSRNVNEGLANYKEVKESAEKKEVKESAEEKKEKNVMEANGAKQAGIEAQLSEVA